jgi:aminopeptidase YwaD
MLKKLRYRLASLAILLLSLILTACGGQTAVSGTAATQINPTVTATIGQTQATVPATRPPNTVTPTRPTQTTPTAIVLPTATPVPATATAVPASPTPALPVNFTSGLAYKHLTTLVDDIGIREAGTPNHEKAGDYIESYFRSLNLRIERPQLSFDLLANRSAGVRFVSNGQPQEIKGTPLRFSTSGKFSVPLANAGLALNGALANGSLNGKIALIERGQNTFGEKVKNAKAAGALAVIIYNNSDSALNGTLGQSFDLAVLGVSKAEGQTLVALANQNAQIEFNVEIVNEKRNFTNVVGIRPALTPNSANAPVLIIGGHHDSVPAGPGANDNGSGTAITLELARVLQTKYPNFELRFIAFGAEEYGLHGSAEYVKNLSNAERTRIKAMLNIDMVAVGNTLYFGGDKTLVQLAFGAANEVGAGNPQGMSADANGSSDHAPFAQAGIPVLFFYRGEDPNYHKATDTSDKIDPNRLGIIGNIAVKVLDGYTNN